MISTDSMSSRLEVCPKAMHINFGDMTLCLSCIAIENQLLYIANMLLLTLTDHQFFPYSEDLFTLINDSYRVLSENSNSEMSMYALTLRNSTNNRCREAPTPQLDETQVCINMLSFF